MVLEWLSRLLSGFFSNLGGSVNSGIWSQGRSSVSENQFQNQQLEKFTPAFTYQTNVENISSFLDNLSNFSYAEQAINRVNQQRQVNLDFIDREVAALRAIEIPTPNLEYEKLKIGNKGVISKSQSYWANELGGLKNYAEDIIFRNAAGTNLVRGKNIRDLRYIDSQGLREAYDLLRRKEEFAIYKTGALNQISTNINNLLQRRDLITSKAPFSL